jgi:hypothetical protein
MTKLKEDPAKQHVKRLSIRDVETRNFVDSVVEITFDEENDFGVFRATVASSVWKEAEEMPFPEFKLVDVRKFSTVTDTWEPTDKPVQEGLDIINRMTSVKLLFTGDIKGAILCWCLHYRIRIPAPEEVLQNEPWFGRNEDNSSITFEVK